MLLGQYYKVEKENENYVLKLVDSTIARQAILDAKTTDYQVSEIIFKADEPCFVQVFTEEEF